METCRSIVLVLALVVLVRSQSCDSQICTCQTGQCTSCVSSFFYMQGPQCLICDYRCKSCSSDKNCSLLSSCAKSYFYNGVTLMCDACPSRCDTCTNSSVCLQCSVGYALANGSCIACQASNALACDTPTTVSQCLDRFWKNGDTCLPCRQNCQQCSGPTSCSQCSPGYLKQVAAGTYCAPCISGCMSCSTNSTCDVCQLNFNLVNGTCANITDACTKAIPNCLACSTTSGLICAVCQPLYYYLNGGCVYGSSVLCQAGSVGPQPYKCSYSCQSGTYKQLTSNSNTTFSCLPLYEVSSGSIYQLYFYATFSAWRFVPSTTINFCSQQTIYSATKLTTLNLSLSPYYKLLVSAKLYPIYLQNYTPSASESLTINLTLSDNATNNDKYSLTGLKLNSSCTPLYVNFSTRNINEQSVTLTVSASLNSNPTLLYGLVGFTQLLLQVYRCSSDCRICANTNYCLECIGLFVSNNQCVDTCGGLFEFYKPTGDPTNYTSKACLSTCPAGFYPNISSNFLCLTCVSPCVTCRSMQQCSSCQSPFLYYTQNFSCLMACPNTYYAKEGICMQCNTPCRTCSNESVCTSCSIGFYNGSSCVASCSVGTYEYQSNNTCIACSSNCKTCSISSTNCLSCPTSFALLASACVTACPTGGYYLNSVNMVCTACQSPCLNCNSSTSCLSCLIGYLHNFTCASTCPTGLYAEGSNNSCIACTNNCLTCASSAICQSCLPTYFLYQSTCISACPKGYFPNPSANSSVGGTCSSCSLPCLTCLSPVLCLTCQSGFLSQVINNTCLSVCEDTYYGRSADQICVKCVSPCLTCTSATTCLTCLPNTTTYLQNNRCVSTCDSGYYIQATVCAPCLYPCVACITTPTTCISCNQPFLLRNQQCVSQCPSGQYAANNNTTCTVCVGDCQTCTDATTCLSCTKALSGPQKYLSGSQCVTACPDKTFPDAITLSCRVCVFPCSTCTDSLSCLSCEIGFLNLLTYRCDFCPSSQYADTIKKQCVPCSGTLSNCDTCVNSTWCTTCSNGSYIYAGKCISAADCSRISGYYLNSQQAACLQCIAPCDSCVSQVACSSCLTGFLVASNQTCSHRCPQYFFADSNSKSCQLCNSTVCRTCANTANTCLDCYSMTDPVKPANNTFNILFNRSCINSTSCPKQYYIEYALATPQCQPCNSPCRECSAETTCISCWSGILQNGTCVASCASGSFSTIIAGRLGCQSCDSSCLTCLNSSTYCLSCPANQLLQSGACVVNCSTAYYADFNTLSCLPCRSPCVTCSSILNCTSCSTNMLLYFGQCVSICPDGSYPSVTQCLQCPTMCQKCKNDSMNVVCTTCSNGKFMIATIPGQCITNCPDGWYPNYGTYQCYQCQTPCGNCQSATSCSTCITGYLIYHGDCLQTSECPPGAFLWPNQPRCQDTCQFPYFADPSTRRCQVSCTPNYLKTSNQTCVVTCPTDYYINSSMACASCYDSQGSYLSTCSQLLSFTVEVRSIFNRLFLRATFTQPYGEITADQMSVSTGKLVASRLLMEQSPLQFIVQASTDTTFTLELLPQNTLSATVVQLRLSNYIVTDKGVLQNLNSSYLLTQYDLYNDQNLSVLDSVESLGKAICVTVTLAFLAALLFNIGCALYQLLDCLQLMFLLLFCNVDFSPALNHFLFGLRYLQFLYLPQIFASDSVQSKLLRLSPNKFGSLLSDITFLGNTGPAFIIVFTFAGLLILCKLADMCINRKQASVADAPPEDLMESPPEKPLRLRLAGLIIDRFRYNYTNDVAYLVYYYLAVFSMTQMLSFTVKNSYNYVSNFFSVVFVIAIGASPFLVFFLVRSYRQQLENPTQITSIRCFTYRLDHELPLARYSMVIRYVRKLVLSLIIVVIMAYPEKQNYPTYLLGLLTLFSFITIVLTALYRPYQLKAEVIYHCVFEVIFLLILVCLSVCSLGIQVLSQAQKLAAGITVIVLTFILFCCGMAYLVLMALRQLYLLLGRRDLLECFTKVQHLDSTNSQTSKKQPEVVPVEAQTDTKLVMMMDHKKPEKDEKTEEKASSENEEKDSEFNPYLNEKGSAPHILIKCIKTIQAGAQIDLEDALPPRQVSSEKSVLENSEQEACEATVQPLQVFALNEPNQIRDFDSMEQSESASQQTTGQQPPVRLE